MAELGLEPGPAPRADPRRAARAGHRRPGAQRPADAAAPRPGACSTEDSMIELLLQAERALSSRAARRGRDALSPGRRRRPAQLDRGRRAGPGRAGARRRGRARSSSRDGRWRSTRRTRRRGRLVARLEEVARVPGRAGRRPMPPPVAGAGDRAEPPSSRAARADAPPAAADRRSCPTPPTAEAPSQLARPTRSVATASAPARLPSRP